VASGYLCSVCRVERFCNIDHQKMGSKEAALGGNLLAGRRRDICGALGSIREVSGGCEQPCVA
jgi:hypothetical protein